MDDSILFLFCLFVLLGFCCWCWPACWCVLSSLCFCCHCFGFFLFCFFFFVCLFLFLERSAVLISMWAGIGWSYNHLLVRKLIFFIFKLYVNLKCDRKTGKFGCNLRELFIILYISNIFLLIYCNFSYRSCLCLCQCVS